MDIKEKVRLMPASPGVYMMKDAGGEVLYVGKADDLRKRVSSYFRKSQHRSDRLEALLSKVHDITYMPTSTSAEALLYENSLIKQLSPKYNVALKDGKSYPMLKLTVNEKFPRLLITRQRKNDGALYFGPYTGTKLLREAVKILKENFPLRSCNDMRRGVCLNYHIKQCLGPCEGKISEERYNDIVKETRLFLEGKKRELVDFLTERMKEASGSGRFEEAAALRDRVAALSAIKEDRISYNPTGEAEELKGILGISGPLERIEAFDISNIMGKEAVGSMVSFCKGRPRKAEYRRFRIKTVKGIDDYGMMKEIIRRRYRRVKEEHLPLPDLVLVDGGKGQLGVASEELKRLGLSDIPVIGLAKEFEHVYMRDRSAPITLPNGSKALNLLKRIRDEAHRFAISYHKSLLSKRVKTSELDCIPGIGEKRKNALMRHFSSLDKIKKASLEDLTAVDGIYEKEAKNIIGYFKE